MKEERAMRIPVATLVCAVVFTLMLSPAMAQQRAPTAGPGVGQAVAAVGLAVIAHKFLSGFAEKGREANQKNFERNAARLEHLLEEGLSLEEISSRCRAQPCKDIWEEYRRERARAYFPKSDTASVEAFISGFLACEADPMIGENKFGSNLCESPLIGRAWTTYREVGLDECKILWQAQEWVCQRVENSSGAEKLVAFLFFGLPLMFVGGLALCLRDSAPRR